MAVKHTATPWHVTGESPRNLHIGSKHSVMVLASMNEVHTDTPANAEFIVRACNAHDDLVKALRKAVQLAEVASDWNLSEVQINGEMVNIYDLKSDFEFALAKAGAA